MKRVVIIGGGLGGLTAAIRLARFGYSCTLFEKKTYPFHRVCGEYISNETLPFLKENSLFPEEFNPPVITRLQLSSVNGRATSLPLDLGGFGISRYVFDSFLAEKATQSGAELRLNCEVEDVTFSDNRFRVQVAGGTYDADIVLGSFGKRSKLDVHLQRRFVQQRSPYVGVKYHIRIDHPDNLIALHNFDGGYCGISNVENGKTNLCYLVHRDQLKRFGTIHDLEEQVLFQNPLLKHIYSNAQFIFQKPETINEVSFATKEPVYRHMLMLGDAAGMITPLCGNGMAMALHSAKLVTNLIRQCNRESRPREWLEQTYAAAWKKTFAKRLRFGRFVQHYLFGRAFTSNLAVTLAVNSRFIARQIIRQTHGQPF